MVSVEGNGSNTGAYSDNQAAPLTLYSFNHNGTSSAALTGTLMLPQTASGANHAISGEYGSSSEGGLQLTGDGKHLVIAGYGVNAATFNANPGSFGSNDPSKPGALAQSTSTLVPRVVAVISSNGSVDTTTALNNVFSQNNPRSVASMDGTSFYVSGQGTGTDQTAGVFYATKGATTATAITGDGHRHRQEWRPQPDPGHPRGADRQRPTLRLSGQLKAARTTPARSSGR